MIRIPCIMLFAVSLSLSGCAIRQAWTPTVDTYNKPNAYSLNRDWAECLPLADQAAVKADSPQVSQVAFRQALRSCLRQRGHTVIN